MQMRPYELLLLLIIGLVSCKLAEIDVLRIDLKDGLVQVINLHLDLTLIIQLFKIVGSHIDNDIKRLV